MSPEIIVALLLFAGAFVASEIGYRLGRVWGSRDEAFAKQLGTISGATFALVAFLIGFGFSGASTRFIDRLDLIVKEANALGTAYLRADILHPPERDELKAALRAYAASRVDLLSAREPSAVAAQLDKVGPQHERIWEIGLRGAAGRPDVMLLVLPPLNEAIDLHSTHLSAARRHIPPAILTALILSAALALALASFGNGQAGRRYPILNFVYGVSLATALWMTIDLDHPTRGLIQQNIQPMIDTLASMKA